MIYVIGLLRHSSKADGSILRYMLMDTLSESYMQVTPNKLKHIISNFNTQVVNANIHNDNIELHEWVKDIILMTSEISGKGFINSVNYGENLPRERCSFTLLASEGNTYKVTRYNGDIAKLPLHKLETLVGQGEVANCSIVNNKGKSEITGIDTYEIIADEKFEESIALKYKAFKAKAMVLGYGSISFDYEIENHQVKLKRYTGLSKNIILPSFITAIKANAFRETTMETVNLNEGLKVIGNRAFAPMSKSDGLDGIEIPSTVEIVGSGAFSNNYKMVKSNGALNISKLKLRNEKTIVIDQFN